MSSDLDRTLTRVSLAGGPVKAVPPPDGAGEDYAHWEITYPAGPERTPTVIEQPLTYRVSTPGTPAEEALIAVALMADARARGCTVDVYEYALLADREPFQVTITPRPEARNSTHAGHQAVGNHRRLPVAMAKAWLLMFSGGRG